MGGRISFSTNVADMVKKFQVLSGTELITSQLGGSLKQAHNKLVITQSSGQFDENDQSKIAFCLDTRPMGSALCRFCPLLRPSCDELRGSVILIIA